MTFSSCAVQPKTSAVANMRAAISRSLGRPALIRDRRAANAPVDMSSSTRFASHASSAAAVSSASHFRTEVARLSANRLLSTRATSSCGRILTRCVRVTSARFGSSAVVNTFAPYRRSSRGTHSSSCFSRITRVARGLVPWRRRDSSMPSLCARSCSSSSSKPSTVPSAITRARYASVESLMNCPSTKKRRSSMKRVFPEDAGPWKPS